MTVLHFIPPLVVGLIAALTGAGVGVVAGLNVYLSIFTAALAGELVLALVMARFVPSPRVTPREALLVAVFCCAVGVVPCVFASSLFLSANLAKAAHERHHHPELKSH